MVDRGWVKATPETRAVGEPCVRDHPRELLEHPLECASGAMCLQGLNRCTRTCQADTECPLTWRCAQAGVQTSFLAHGSPIGSVETTLRLCLPPDFEP